MNDTNSEGCGRLAGHRQSEGSAQLGTDRAEPLAVSQEEEDQQRPRLSDRRTSPFRPSAASWSSVVPASKRLSGTSAGRRVRITAAMCTSPHVGAYQPFRPRRAANSSTAWLNTRQVAATHPANFAGLTAVGFRGHMMRHAARSSLEFSSTLIRASWAISPEASSIRFGTGISWSSQ